MLRRQSKPDQRLRYSVCIHSGSRPHRGSWSPGPRGTSLKFDIVWCAGYAILVPLQDHARRLVLGRGRLISYPPTELRGRLSCKLLIRRQDDCGKPSQPEETVYLQFNHSHLRYTSRPVHAK